MMGHINNLVVELVRENLGEEGVNRLFLAAGLDKRPYHPEVIYPEEEFQALFRGAQAVFGADAETAEKAFSKYFMHVSPTMFPGIFRFAGSARGLLERVPHIHRTFPSAAAQASYEDKIAITESSPERLVIEYRSPNRLCVTLQTVASLTLAHYGEAGAVSETACMKKGDPKCVVVVEFHGAAPAPEAR
jgi:hypothetical protein